MILTVEAKRPGDQPIEEVAVCFDDDGLHTLIDKLQRLQGKCDHTHLMTPAWAGNELTEEKQGGAEYELVNHVRLVKL
jgi:hypothetical protein